MQSYLSSQCYLQKQLISLMELARSLWIQVLVEVHSEGELKRALDAGAEIIGINNRNLHTFETDLLITEHIASQGTEWKDYCQRERYC